MEVGNIIHLESYTPQGLSDTERLKLIQARDLGREIVNWIISNFQIVGPESAACDFMSDFYWPYLASQVANILRRKSELATSQDNISPISSRQVESRISATFSGVSQFYHHYDQLDIGNPLTFSWTGPAFELRRHEEQYFTHGKANHQCHSRP